MTKSKLFTAFLLCLTATALGQKQKNLSIDFMLRGHIYAQSSVKDTTAFGGFAESNNAPRKIHAGSDFSERGLFLKIDTTQSVVINGKYNGYTLYIANKSDTTVQLDASDSRLYAIAEVYYNGRWQPIEYLPSSWCGNSYHRVFLQQNEYWSFDIPVFRGKIKTRLRYRLTIGKDKYLYSNEVLAGINPGQLTKKEGHNPNGIMDPYYD